MDTGTRLPLAQERASREIQSLLVDAGAPLSLQTGWTFQDMIGIVGAGISGLALGAFLDQRGADFRIWEATDRTGGVIRSSVERGRVLDHGPQRTRSTTAVRDLIEWAGMTEEIVEVPPSLPLYVYRQGRLRRVPFDFFSLLRTDLISLPGKLRLLMEPLTAGYRREETVADFFTRKFGSEAYRAFLGPLFGGLYGSDPADILVRHALAGTLRGMGIQRSILGHFVRGSFNREEAPPAVSFRTGLQAWTDALADRLSGRIVRSTAVERLDRAPDGWDLTDSSGDRNRVQRLVLTVPAPAAAGLLRGVAPDAAGRLQRLRYNELVMVHLLSDGPTGGLGYQVGYGEQLRTRGVTWNAAALGRDGVYTAFLGGSRDPEILELSEVEIGAIAARDFERVTGHSAEVLSVGNTRVPSWDRSWSAMEGMELPGALDLCTNYESRVGIPGRVRRALELADELTG